MNTMIQLQNIARAVDFLESVGVEILGYTGSRYETPRLQLSRDTVSSNIRTLFTNTTITENHTTANFGPNIIVTWCL